jgi:transcriptional regulator with XRE-family HTH domain
MFDKLSEELKAARINAGISLQQLATRTRIDLKFLEYIEDGNFSFLPELYVKAFLKEYIKFVGLDEKIIFKKYDAYKIGKEYVEQMPETLLDKIKELKENKVEKEKVHPYSIPVSYSPPSSAQSSNPLDTFLKDKKKVLFASIVVGILVIFFGVYFIFIKKSPDIIVEKPYDELVNESKERYIEDEPSKTTVDSNAGNSLKSDTLRLFVTANDSCWVKALIDDSIKEEFNLLPHGHKMISAVSNFKITFGNSFRVQMQLNNKPLNFEAKSKVSVVSIDANGISNLNSTINQKK